MYSHQMYIPQNISAERNCTLHSLMGAVGSSHACIHALPPSVRSQHQSSTSKEQPFLNERGRKQKATYLGPKRLIAQITLPLQSAMTPTPVNSQPSPTALISGCATTTPAAEKMLRTKLLAATPEEARRGMNSVSMVVAMAKMSMEPMPKKKLAMSCGGVGQ